MRKVAVVYHIWPHYRGPVMEALDRSDRIAYTFFSGGTSYEGIEHVDRKRVQRFALAPYRKVGSAIIQAEAVRVALRGEFDAVIYLADAHFLTNWVAAVAARLRGTRVLFWGHGWLRREAGAKGLVRKLFYGLSDRLLVYAERGKRIGEQSGFPARRITTVYNSLDTTESDAVFDRIENGFLNEVDPRAFFANRDAPIAVCIARITEKCRFDLLVEAASILATRGRPLNVLLVGEGPERAALEAQATALGVPVHFFGASYDEAVNGQLIYRSDVTVSPGKIGLTAMHTLVYGTPAITHDNFDEQMPEVEAIEAGVSGGFFRQGDALSLADAIADWLDAAHDRAKVRAACRAVIHEKWNPENQAKIIESAILETLGDRV